MTGLRSYGDGCATAHALDLVGERWALLVVRGLLLGPKRFTDLRASLRGASANVLTQRLHELEAAGILRRHRAGPPSGGYVYELTDWGRDLEPVLTSLGRWGRRSPHLEFDPEVGVDALMLALRGRFDPGADPDLRASYQLYIGDDPVCVRVGDGQIDITRGFDPRADATVVTGTRTFAELLVRRRDLDAAVVDGLVRIKGDAVAFTRLLDAVPLPQPVVLAAFDD